MRSRLIVFSLLFGASALAAPPSVVPPLALDEVPEPCKAIAKQATAVNLATVLSARISLANCLADTKLAKLKLLDCEDSILEVEAATAQSFELLDGVIAATTDDTTKIVAQQQKAELYNSMVTRMMATLPPPGTTEATIALHTARKGILEGLVAKWKDAAAVSYEAILAIVKAKPALEKNRLVSTAVRTAKDRLRLHVASAPPAPSQPAPDEASAPARNNDGGDGGDDDKAPKADTGEELR